jgi:UDP-N-acetylglucosamine 2-epimerase
VNSRYAPGELAPLGEGRGPQYVPMPDHLILESEEARYVLSSSGYPLDRLHVLGAPRLDALANAPRWHGPDARADGPMTVLVIFGGTDGGQIMGTVRPVLNSAANYHFIFKPHPRSSVQTEQIERFLSVGQRSSRGSTYEIASGDIYRLLANADAVVTTYSSAGMEAAALGYPVVTLNLPDFASPSGLMDMSGNVRFAASPEALADALQASAATTQNNITGDVERAFFSRLDGNAQERWAETIARLAREHSAS